MIYEVLNKTYQVINLLAKDKNTGIGKTIPLMPKGKEGSKKEIEEAEVTQHIQGLFQQKVIGLRQI